MLLESSLVPVPGAEGTQGTFAKRVEGSESLRPASVCVFAGWWFRQHGCVLDPSFLVATQLAYVMEAGEMEFLFLLQK